MKNVSTKHTNRYLRINYKSTFGGWQGAYSGRYLSFDSFVGKIRSKSLSHLSLSHHYHHARQLKLNYSLLDDKFCSDTGHSVTHKSLHLSNFIFVIQSTGEHERIIQFHWRIFTYATTRISQPHMHSLTVTKSRDSWRYLNEITKIKYKNQKHETHLGYKVHDQLNTDALLCDEEKFLSVWLSLAAAVAAVAAKMAFQEQNKKKPNWFTNNYKLRIKNRTKKSSRDKNYLR